MSTALEINGKELHPIKDASLLVSYSRDYITRLAREKKIIATHVGRQWYVDIDSLKSYAESATMEQELRKKRLSEERKQEQKIKIAAREKALKRNNRSKNFHVQAAAFASFVLAVGLMGGLLIVDFANDLNPNFQTQGAAVAERTQMSSDNFALDQIGNEPSSNMRSIGEDVEQGVLLLPHGDITAEPEEMFSDEIMVLTTPDGGQAVVRVDADGKPVGEVIPFVNVPVNHGSK